MAQESEDLDSCFDKVWHDGPILKDNDWSPIKSGISLGPWDLFSFLFSSMDQKKISNAR